MKIEKKIVEIQWVEEEIIDKIQNWELSDREIIQISITSDNPITLDILSNNTSKFEILNNILNNPYTAKETIKSLCWNEDWLISRKAKNILKENI